MFATLAVIAAGCGNTAEETSDLDDLDAPVSSVADVTSSEPLVEPALEADSSPRSVAAGPNHVCHVADDGLAYCWGSNRDGELGDGTDVDRLIPVAVAGLSTTSTAIAAGKDHTCAVLAGGDVACWGSNDFAQLGDGTTNGSVTPVEIEVISGATSLAAGFGHSCALLDVGDVLCWGANLDGQLGDGSTNASAEPVAVAGISGATSITAGFGHSCAVGNGGSVSCWGLNEFGQLGDGTTGNASSTPVVVEGITGATAIVAGFAHTCVLLEGGAVSCWGFNDDGQLGDGTTANSSVPVMVGGVSDAVVIAAGNDHSCAALADGRVACWGSNAEGELGDGTNVASAMPVVVQGINDATAVAAGFAHSCALQSDGTIDCWGANRSGQLGDGTENGSATPVRVLLDTDS